MDLQWFHDTIDEELDGAMTYAKKAIELKSMSEKMAKTFYDMANQEMEHAKNLFQMGIDYYDKVTDAYSTESIPEYLSDIKDKIVECYTSKSLSTKLLIGMYKD